MKRPNYQLFLGFHVDEVFHSALNQVAEDVKVFFIQDDDTYLHRVRHNGKVYLGKFLGDKSDLQNLRDVETNIYSLLGRLVPTYPCEETPLRLFPAEKAVR
ncbi:MAG: hypothetical protein VX777_07805 [Chlamydiota bacterium]|nr:hypothetical protein [Chlamydiota bacterium]